jgi:hypothetical protein
MHEACGILMMKVEEDSWSGCGVELGARRMGESYLKTLLLKSCRARLLAATSARNRPLQPAKAM